MAGTWAYFDTSALVKRYVSEPGSLRVGQLLRRHDFLSSALTPVELLSGLSRRRRDGDLSDRILVALLRRIRSDRTWWELVEVEHARKGWEYYTKNRLWHPDADINMEGLQIAMQVYGEQTQAKGPLPSPAKYVDQSYLKEALKELGTR